MKILFILDPIKKLDWKWDNSLCLLREFARRNHQVFVAEITNLSAQGDTVYAQTQRVDVKATKSFYHPTHLTLLPKQPTPLIHFALIVFRKEPPFDANYLYATFLLEKVAKRIPISNNPTGIRNLNEKMSILNFKKWIPETLVSSSPDKILDFQNRLKKDLVVKPLDQKGGRGVFILSQRDPKKNYRLNRATSLSNKFVMAQEYLNAPRFKEKRIVILNGKLLTAYEKRGLPGEFRSNLGLGGTWHATQLSKKELKLVADLRPTLISEGIHLAGIDVLGEKLIEINVTCPAGINEATVLYPQLELVKVWASFLESLRPEN